MLDSQREDCSVCRSVAVSALSQTFSSRKEYIMGLAEQLGFAHIHIHVVRRPEGLPEEHRGLRIFKRLNPSPEAVIPPDEVIRLSEELGRRMRRDEDVWEAQKR